MKHYFLITVIIFAIGAVIVFYDSRHYECEVTLSGVLTDFQPVPDSEGAKVEIDGKISAAKSLSYRNAPWRKAQVSDCVSLVLERQSQYLYYQQIDEDYVRYLMLTLYSLSLFFLCVMLGFALKCFKINP